MLDVDKAGGAAEQSPQQPAAATTPRHAPACDTLPREAAAAKIGRVDRRPPVQVGTIAAGSTAPAHIVLSISLAQAARRLIGLPVWFEFRQDGTNHLAFGQITSVGAAGFGAVAIGGAFAVSDQMCVPSVLGTMPAAGAPVFEADGALIEKVIAGRPDSSYVGTFHGCDAGFPAFLPPFDASGAGPYNIGVYGARGAGKSSLARAVIASFARSPASSILAIDLEGSLVGRDGSQGGGGEEAGGLLGEACRQARKRFLSYGVGDLVLDRWDLFYDVLRESDMLRALLPDEDGRDVFMGMIRAMFHAGGKFPMARLRERGAYDGVVELLCSGDAQDAICPADRHARSMLARRIEAWRPRAYDAHWLPLAELFNAEGRKRVSGVVRNGCAAGKNRPVIVVDLSKKSAPDGMLWNDGVRAIVARRIMREIAAQGDDRYGSGGRLDMLAVLCAAEAMAPRIAPSDRRLSRLRDAAIGLARSSREYGLSLMFLSRTLAGLHPSLYADNRTSFYGSGLSSAAEEQAMSEVMPSGFADSYRAFVAPRADWDGKSPRPFMSGGLATRLSATTVPMLFTAHAPSSSSSSS